MFQTSTTDINHGAIALASGRAVEVIRQAAGRRALFLFEDSMEMHALLDAYEAKKPLPIPAKEILNARTKLFYQAKRVSMEGI